MKEATLRHEYRAAAKTPSTGLSEWEGLLGAWLQVRATGSLLTTAVAVAVAVAPRIQQKRLGHVTMHLALVSHSSCASPMNQPEGKGRRWVRTTSSFLMESGLDSPRKGTAGGLNCTLTSVLRSFSALPAFITNGTPDHLQTSVKLQRAWGCKRETPTRSF